MDNAVVTLYHSPRTRSQGVLILLEELGAPYELRVLNMKIGEQSQPDYLAINPLGKVPAIRHRGELVTEQVAIYIYLADLFPQRGRGGSENFPDFKAAPQFLRRGRNVNQRQIARRDLRANSPQFILLAAGKDHLGKPRTNRN